MDVSLEVRIFAIDNADDDVDVDDCDFVSPSDFSFFCDDDVTVEAREDVICS